MRALKKCDIFQTVNASAPSIRIHVYLAQLGYGSRRSIESLIEKGKVQINGKTARLGQKIDPATDEIQIKGQKILSREREPLFIILNKPRGVVTTRKDPQGRPTVMNLIPRQWRKILFPVGRLDLNSEGLLLLTNDGELAHHLMHPSFEVPKVYEVKIRGELSKSKIEHLKKGMRINGEKYKGADILSIDDVTRTGFPKAVVKMRIYEGKNLHIRKMFNHLRCHVLKLKRVSLGSLSVKGIASGEYRVLESKEIEKLRREYGLSQQKGVA